MVDINPEIIENPLLVFSAWLDSNGLMADPIDGDDRTHNDLVDEFLKTLMDDSTRNEFLNSKVRRGFDDRVRLLY